MKVKKDNKTIEVTEKAFRVVYKDLGYQEVKESKKKEKEGK